MWAIIHLISWLMIVVFTCGAIISYSKSEKTYTIMVMINRCFYILVILSGVMMIQYSWETNPLLAILKLLFGILTIGIVEMLLSIRKKGKTSTTFIIIFFIAIIITASLGFYLSGGYPIF